MAILHAAQLRPSKIELLRQWLPAQGWFSGDAATLEVVGAYRFDDPDGEVGIETHLVRSATGPVLQVPLTYRGAPLAGADDWLISTMEHTVLGNRWVYDACGDPVYSAALAGAILTGGTEAALERHIEGRVEQVDPTVRVLGTGTIDGLDTVGLVNIVQEGPVTVIETSVAQLSIRRVLDASSSLLGDAELIGTWSGVGEPTTLAVAHPR